MTYVLIIAAVILALIGIVGAVVPGIAGTPFSFLALLVLSFVKGINYSTEFLMIMFETPSFSQSSRFTHVLSVVSTI